MCEEFIFEEAWYLFIGLNEVLIEPISNQIKFRSSHTILEICRTSGPSKQVALNRELVQLLESLGASRDGIRQLQQEVNFR